MKIPILIALALISTNANADNEIHPEVTPKFGEVIYSECSFGSVRLIIGKAKVDHNNAERMCREQNMEILNIKSYDLKQAGPVIEHCKFDTKEAWVKNDNSLAILNFNDHTKVTSLPYKQDGDQTMLLPAICIQRSKPETKESYVGIKTTGMLARSKKPKKANKKMDKIDTKHSHKNKKEFEKASKHGRDRHPHGDLSAQTKPNHAKPMIPGHNSRSNGYSPSNQNSPDYSNSNRNHVSKKPLKHQSEGHGIKVEKRRN